jgi:hypothetical protein
MRRWIATGLLATMLAGLTPGLALAGSGGRRNTAIGLTAGALYTWLNGGTKRAGRRNTALALTAGSVVAWHKYKKAKRAERRRARLANYYRDRYYTSYRPYSRVSGYRSSYAAPAYYRGRSYRRSGYRRTASRRSSNRYCRTAYRRGYRAGYRAGVRAAA